MANKKTIFIAFAIEDERQRDFLKGQSLNTNSPFEYIDMSVKEAYDTDWKAGANRENGNFCTLSALSGYPDFVFGNGDSN